MNFVGASLCPKTPPPWTPTSYKPFFSDLHVTVEVLSIPSTLVLLFIGCRNGWAAWRRSVSSPVLNSWIAKAIPVSFSVLRLFALPSVLTGLNRIYWSQHLWSSCIVFQILCEDFCFLLALFAVNLSVVVPIYLPLSCSCCVLALDRHTLVIMTAFQGLGTLFSSPCLLTIRLHWHGANFKMTFPFSLPILESFCSTSSDRDLGWSEVNAVWFSL